MKELQEIVKAFDAAQQRGLKTALATVVNVVGSAYRHEGARMLVTENGELTGAISGGCLEGDALRKARLAISENRNMLVTYDTTDEDDATLGVGLGCNGIIQVLLEPIDTSSKCNPIEFFRCFLSKRQDAVLGTFFNLNDKLSHQPGTSILVAEKDIFFEEAADSFKSDFLEDAEKVLLSQQSVIKDYPAGVTAFIEYLKPSIHLMVFGAGNDAIPLVQIASVLGWQVSVVDGRSNYATSARFPAVYKVLVAKPEEAAGKLQIDKWSVAVLMTHNYNYDLAMLKELLDLRLPYIGALGPKKKLQRMIEELRDSGALPEEESLNTVFGPTGLDIGSETPEEIALSIVSEIKAVLTNRPGISLKYRMEEQNDTGSVSKKHRNAKFVSCAINL